MCRMLGKVSVAPSPACYELLDAPHSLLHQSSCGRQPQDPTICGPHASGCGIAWRDSTGVLVEKRGAEDRWNDTFTEAIRSLKTEALIAHNRLASAGLKIDVSCSHPFQAEHRGAPVAFCHNGGVQDLMERARSEGVSDSQIFFEKLLSEVGALEHGAITEYIKCCAESWEYSSLNALLLTTNALHVWRCFNEQSPRATQFEMYYSLYVRSSEQDICVASEALDSSPKWHSVPNRTLLTYTHCHDHLSLEQSRI